MVNKIVYEFEYKGRKVEIQMTGLSGSFSYTAIVDNERKESTRGYTQHKVERQTMEMIDLGVI